MSGSNSQLSFLFVHQSAELYGSDRTFVQSIRACRKEFPECKITVYLPFEGPLLTYVRPFVDQVIIDDLIILRKSTLFREVLFRPINFFRRILAAKGLVNCHDLTYINTVVVLDFILASRFSRKPCVIHVHELPVRFVKVACNLILWFSRGNLIFNSNATSLAYPAVRFRKNYIIPNGTVIYNFKPIPESSFLRILLIGRFGKWKGHVLLLQALSVLPKEKRAVIQVRFIGSAFKGQEHFQKSIREDIVRLGLGEQVEIYDFVDDPTVFYHWANLVVVPSTLPESFGLVAVEAMGHGRPVVAAKNGGIADVVEENITGLLFVPGDAYDLSRKLLVYIDNPDLLIVHGGNGRSAFLKRFQEDRFLGSIGKAIEESLSS